jgi:type II secretory pathway pseudopilin PulG
MRRIKPSEEGYLLVAVMFLLALLTISMSVALPKVIKEIQRDRELETMNRGKQYIRGVRLYYKKFGGYPPNVDALVKPTNNIRFLRKKYADPTTGKEDWKPVLMGQNKAPTVMGFFGVPLGGVGACATSDTSGTNTQSNTSSNSFGGSSNSFGSNAGSLATNGTNCGNGLNQSSGASTATGGTNPADPNATNTNNPAGSTTGQPGLGGQSGQTFGGAGIIGFSPNSPKKSIMVYKTKDHYNEWEFVYDPLAEQMMASGASGGNIGNNAGLNTGGTPPGSTPSIGGSNPPGVTPTPGAPVQ